MKIRMCFNEIKQTIISNIEKAEKEIRVAIAWFTDEDIMRALTQRKEKGVHVSVIISDAAENFKNISRYKQYLKTGGELHIATKQFMHHKYCIIDEKIILNGSYNWSYAAATNEENLMVITIDHTLKEDALLVQQLLIRHRRLSENISEPVPDIPALKAFCSSAREINIQQAITDEEEIRLRMEFENDVTRSIEISRQLKIPVGESLIERMHRDGGGVDFVKRILHDEITSGEMKPGFRNLITQSTPRPELSFEYLASRKKYERLFTDAERKFCNDLMRKYGLQEIPE